ncbi:alpha/beta-Hydrolase [Glarea lozoyensis ATCC 20868]|uniref:Carboxylic ester hydrolase n=1 Tax=Glarea lozoyensis (strain ATCC 20868 / MF5171) TaxID=1116229 RepID=S3CH45_GLAL2|nr:alpha/beta-Hydrolase [Glarea lozoyensis ATCC 20868]EPE24619.1 alpha/beta-Hydrolase [Glarea lozoyensis ATCC 20868]
MKGSTYIPYLTTFLPICSANPFLQVANTNGTAGAAACEAIGKSLAIENVTVNFAQYVTAGTTLNFTQQYNLQTCGDASALIERDMCRIASTVRTSERSELTLETWLPTNWTGRFLSTGNGGVSGCIQYRDLKYTLGLGFATVGANNGHNGTSGLAFYNNTEVVHDFADRSIHLGVVIGKQITAQYYGSPHTKSYYLGCSTGGRQGFKSVQTYPEDFDGVVAGATAFAFTNLTSWSATFYKIFGANASAPTYIPAGKLWTVIHNEVLRQCDGLDGVVDGILEDPSLCQFRPEALICGSKANGTDCLSSAQAGAVREALSDYYGVDGSLIYPGMQPGSEIFASRVLYAAGPFPYSVDWFRYVVYNDPTWSADTFSRQDAANAAQQNPYDIQTWNGDLSAFASRGGKVLHYHGLMDGIISSANSARYYNHVSRTMGLRSDELDKFYRFFRVSGMGHCSGGDGAHAIGNQISEAQGLEKEDNVLARMVAWVEGGDGEAPEFVRGTRWVNDTKALGVDYTRKHCKYPLRNTCVDPANSKKEEAWKCV